MQKPNHTALAIVVVGILLSLPAKFNPVLIILSYLDATCQECIISTPATLIRILGVTIILLGLYLAYTRMQQQLHTP